MNVFSRIVFVIVASICLYSAATAQKQLITAAAVADSGTFDGKLYSNSVLGFTILVPGGWTVFTNNQDAATLASGQQNTKVSAASLSQKERDDLARSMSNTQVLFQASSLTKVNDTSTGLLSCGAEKLMTAITKEQYLEANKKLVLLRPGLQVVRDTYSISAGGAAFVGFDVAGTTHGKFFRQNYLVTVRKGVAVFLVSTLLDEKNDRVIDASINTLKFGK